MPPSWPRVLFEVSWEVAHKIGGIHTVLVGKAPYLATRKDRSYLLVGPYGPSRTGWQEAPLLEEWREYFHQQKGYTVHAGYWQVGSQALTTLLIDFYPLVARKNTLFAQWWEDYGVDSLWGGWDYIEPALFGYAAGEAIASFCDFYYGEEVEALAHFHEWLTGTGVLYLRKAAPHIATLFTTHATVAGRAAGGQLLPLEGLVAWLQERNLQSKHSLERAAWQHADATTTVSPLTSREAAHYLGHAADVLTPNGWDPPSSLPVEKARQWLDDLARQWNLQKPVFWLLHGGRPELENKGTLLLLETLERYRKAPEPDQVLGVILALPADIEKPAGPPARPLWLSHTLRHPEADPLWQRLQAMNLQPHEPIRIAYLPLYLEGHDGAVDLPYYALLAAVDASAFPSRYEPWGYTPQESLGLGVPTASSRQSGFGQWMQAQGAPLGQALFLVDYEKPDPAGQLLEWLHRRLRATPTQREKLRSQARELARSTRWTHFLPLYEQAYEVARAKARARLSYRKPASRPASATTFVWHRAFFTPILPEPLQPLRSLAYNLWWTWHPEAQALFAQIDPNAWEAHHNPVWLLNHLPSSTWQVLSQNSAFLARLEEIHKRFKAYVEAPARTDLPTVAYLCMEFGLTRCLPFYAGGLGILAGDYLKEASDANYPILGIGLLYRKGYFTQRISPEGDQIAETPALRFTDLPLEPVRQPDERWLRLRLPLGSQTLYLKVWRLQVGRVAVYLLDADLPENPEPLRTVTHRLYPAQAEERLQQEIVLGFGAQALVEALGLSIDLFHYNEGHAAFHALAHWAWWRKAGLSVQAALERVRATTIFTTHTPVPAGHDAFPPERMRPYLETFVTQEIGLSWDSFRAMGQMPPDESPFSLSAFCVRVAARTNAVSQLHGQVSRQMFASLYPGYRPAEVPIQGLTNGVHRATWQHPDWIGRPSSPAALWETHQTLKKRLLAYLQQRLLRAPWPLTYLKAVQAFFASTDENTLLLGFARRLATYKRHLLLLENEEFAQLLQEAPVRLLLAGKAHPHDEAGKATLRTLWEKLDQPPYRGKVLFLPDYDMELAHWLVSGVDVWLNLPVYGQEASGTSGMKAGLNGVLHLSLPDGWWAEVDAEAAGGWTVPPCPSQDPVLRDAWEAAQTVFLLREEVLPLYLRRTAEGFPTGWIERMERAQAYMATRFTTGRMLEDYIQHLYRPLAQRQEQLTRHQETFQARQAFLEAVEQGWPTLIVKRLLIPPFEERAQPASTPFSMGIEVEPGTLPPEALRAEALFEDSSGRIQTFPLPLQEPHFYAADLSLPDPGVYHCAIRLYAWDPFLEERLWPWAKLF